MTRSYLKKIASSATAMAFLAGVFVLADSAPAAAIDQMLVTAKDNAITPIVNRIRAENVRIDVGMWKLTEHLISIALGDAKDRGVLVRLICDRVSIWESDPATRNEIFYLAQRGVPIRIRENPRDFPQIIHWKYGMWIGQNVLEFGSANWTTYELAPDPSNPTGNYHDETAYFTDDPALMASFKTKFDRMWVDTTSFVDFPDAYAIETGSDWFRTIPDPSICWACTQTLPQPMTISRLRLEPENALSPDVVWGQGDDFNNRLIDEINKETSAVDFVFFRVTVDNVTDALINKFRSGVPVRVIVEPTEYRDGLWPEYTIGSYEYDRMWVAGIPMKQRIHDGLTHMKNLITSTIVTNASSNIAANWQRDHDYFMSAAAKPDMYAVLKNRFQYMWTDTTGFANFTPLPPNTPKTQAPVSGATGVSTTPTLQWSNPRWAISYDVFVGSSATNVTSKIGSKIPGDFNFLDVPTISWTVPAGLLQPATRYYWKVVARTVATDRDPSLIATSSVSSFTTAGSGGGGGGGGTATEQVIYATDVTAYSAGWSKVSDASAAAGIKLVSPDNGVMVSSPLAQPTSYFDASFQAVAGVRYRLWLRIHAQNESKYNDSVYVQFDGSLNASGVPVYRIGSTDGLLVNLWTCSTCQSTGWGWQNTAYWLEDTGDVWFATSGPQTVRVQVREDGAQIDQIVISPATYLNAPPGPVSGDNTIVPKPQSQSQPPSAPVSPIPVNGATGVALSPTLSWSAAGALQYNVFFGMTNPPPQVSTAQPANTYTPGTLSASTTCYWQIVATNASGSTAGPVWSFSTAGAALPNIVFYASDIPNAALHGVWSKAADASAAGGTKLTTPDNGWSSVDQPLDAPSDYVDVTFTANAGVPYTLWLRLKALNDSKWNDSVWVQFSDALAGGSAAYPLNTASGLGVNLESCSGCGTSAWGWQNTSWWAPQPATVTFANSGTHTLRIQIREDGVSLDQIVLSPQQYLNSAPGPVKNDATIVPKP